MKDTWSWKVVWFYVTDRELMPYLAPFNQVWLRISWGK
jgi:hypothetical protein